MASASRAHWVLNLEDDVTVLQPIQLDKLQHDINGDNPDTSLPGLYVALLLCSGFALLQKLHFEC